MTEILDQSDLADRAAAMIDAARRAGADAADAVSMRGISLSVDVREGAVEESSRAEGDDIALRVFVGKRTASVSGNLHVDPAMLAERAVAMARAAPEDRFAGLADPALLARDFPDLDLLDTTMPSSEDLTERAQAADEAARSVEGVAKSGGASAGWGLGGMVLVTSDGFSGSYLRSRFSVSATAIAGEGTGMERDYDYDSRTYQSDLADASAIGREAGVRAVRRLDPRKGPSGRIVAVFDPRVSGGVVGHFTAAINAAAIARGTSFLRDRLGERVFGEGIRITDDPLKPRGAGSRPFDGEGVAGEPLDLVADGILKTWVLDSASGRELGLPTNGRAGRGGAQPSPGITNVTLHPGTEPPADLVAQVESGLYVTSLIGHGVNQVTGDYSRGASGFAIENGEITYPVSEVTIAANLRDMFLGLRVADDLPEKYRINAPTLAIDGMMLGGG